MLTAATLALVLQACAPTVNPQTQAALISVESGGNAFAILDDNDGRSYYPRNYRDAVILTEKLIGNAQRRYGSRNRGIDVGITQINSLNFVRYGLTPEYALDPCINLRTGSLMLTSAYSAEYRALASQRLPENARQQMALSRALQIYNSGSPTGDQRYVASIVFAVNSNLQSRLTPRAMPVRAVPDPQNAVVVPTTSARSSTAMSNARFYRRPGLQRVSFAHQTDNFQHAPENNIFSGKH